MIAGLPKVSEPVSSGPVLQRTGAARNAIGMTRGHLHMNRTFRPGKRLYGTLTALVSAVILFSAFAGIAVANDDGGLTASQGLPEASALPAVATSTASLEATYAPLTATAIATVTPPASPAPAPTVAKVAPAPAAKKPAAKKTSSQLALARKLLRKQIVLHPILKGTTVSIGKTPGNYQAVAYYTTGHIVINPRHRASLARIIAHEVWHVIDWRDNHRIDWGERVPR